jgi:hypothetical protein
MPHIVYITTHIATGKVYIGVHEQEQPYEFDGYFGSGKHLKRAVKKYGITAFITAEEAYAKEAEIVTEEFIKHPWNYNMTVGGKIPPKTTLESGRKAYETRKQLGTHVNPPKPLSGSAHHNHGGFRWITDGVTDKTMKKNGQLPTGWNFGRTKGLNSNKDNNGRFC